MAESFDPYYTWLGIPPEEQPADHYRLLGVRRFEANEEVIINASDQRMSFVRTFQTGKRAKESQRLLNEIAAAQSCLLHPRKKLAYDEDLRRKLGQNSASQPAGRPVEAQPAARPASVPARALPVASPLHQSATPSQPLDLRNQPLPAERRAPVATANPLSLLELDTLASVQIAANPLRPVVTPRDSVTWTPRMLIVAGSAAGALVVLLGVVVWAATRPGADPVAEVPAVASDASQTTPPPKPAGEIASEASARSGTSAPDNRASTSSSAAPAPPVTEAAPAPPPSISIPMPPVVPTAVETVARGSSDDPIIARVRDFQPLPVSRIALSPDGRAIVTYANDNRRWRLEVPSLASAVSRDNVAGIVLADDGALFAFLDGNGGTIFRWRSREDSTVPAEIRTGRPVRAGAFSQDGTQFIVAVSGPEPLLAYQVDGGKPLSPIPTSLSEVSWLGVFEDWLICWSPEKKAEAISLKDGERRTFEGEMNYPPLTMMRSGQTSALVVPWRASASRLHFHYWNLLTGQKYLEFQLEGTTDFADVLAVSRDGRFGALRRGKALAILNLLANQELTRIEWPEGSFQAAALTAEDGVLAMNAPGDSVCIVDVEQLLAKPRWQFVLRDGQHELAGAEAVAGNVPPMAPPPAADLSEAGMADAHAALKAAGVSLSDNPQEVYSIQTGNSKVTGEDAKHIAAFASLQHLDLGDTPAAPAILKELPILPKVRGLRLGGSPVTDQDLAHLKKFPAIRSLDLQRTLVKGPGLEHLKHTPNITFLDLPYEGLTREALPGICQLKSVEIVQPFPPGLTDDDLRLVGELKKLRHLSLGQSKIQGPGLAHLKDLQSLDGLDLPPTFPPQELGHLVTLNLKSVHFPAGSGDPELVHFAGMQRLERVNAPEQMTDEGMKILSTFPALKYVYLAPCDRITDVGMAHLTGAQALREIALPRHLSDQALVPLAMLPNLEYVHLERTSAITSSGLAPLTGKPSLKRLFIGSIADKTCLDQLKRMPGLEVLGVWYDGPASAEFIRGLKEIKTIKEINFARVTFDIQSLEALQQLTMLETLLIQHFKLDQGQRNALQKALPKCRLVN